MKPHEIEQLSFQIIDSEAGTHDFSADQWQVVRRVIHTSADFEWQTMIRMHPEAIVAGVAAIRSGCAIITDTNMARVGIRRRDLVRFGGTVGCYMADERVAETAAREGITRAKAAVDLAAAEISGGIYVVGNAPTALLRLIELMEGGQGYVRPWWWGFRWDSSTPPNPRQRCWNAMSPISPIVGRKGGSNVAAAVVNALIVMAGAEN